MSGGKLPGDFRRRLARFDADDEEAEDALNVSRDSNESERPSNSNWKRDNADQEAAPERPALAIPKINISAKASLRATTADQLNAKQLARARIRHLEPMEVRGGASRDTPEAVKNRRYPASKRQASPPPDPTGRIWYGRRKGKPTEGEEENPRRRLVVDEWDNVDPALVPRRQSRPKAPKRSKEDHEVYDPATDRWQTASELLGKDAEKKGLPAPTAQSERVRKPFACPTAVPAGLGAAGRSSSDAGPTNAASPTKAAAEDKCKFEAVIEAEILQKPSKVTWGDVMGLEQTKQTLMYATVWPLKCPEHFKGLRAPPKGVLLYGPPGTGKTMLASCIAAQAGATFLNVSASSLFSKWIGEGEKLIRALFTVARRHVPAVVFIDEIDGLLCTRSTGSGSGESETTRRMKNEFLAQMEGLSSEGSEGLLVLGATNLPQALDPAARRRFAQRIYVPLPDKAARLAILKKHLTSVSQLVKAEELEAAAESSEGYSGSDLLAVAKEAAAAPVERLFRHMLPETFRPDDPPFPMPGPVMGADLAAALAGVRPSVAAESLAAYEDFRRAFGSERRN